MTDADRPAFLQIVIGLTIALRESKLDSPTLNAYFTNLRDLELEWVAAAADRLAQSAQWFPKTSEWRAIAQRIEVERRNAQDAYLRQLPVPLCADCRDYRMVANPETGRYGPCHCQPVRRLELLGRRPWPALPEHQENCK